MTFTAEQVGVETTGRCGRKPVSPSVMLRLSFGQRRHPRLTAKLHGSRLACMNTVENPCSGEALTALLHGDR